MILNNCTTCGRKPRIGISGWSSDVWCRCGKIVKSNGGIWSEDVAADMWNRANPEQRRSIETEHINRLADTIAKMGIVVDPTGNDLEFKMPEQKGVSRAYWLEVQLDIRTYKQDLTEFYKKRLEPGAIA